MISLLFYFLWITVAVICFIPVCLITAVLSLLIDFACKKLSNKDKED